MGNSRFLLTEIQHHSGLRSEHSYSCTETWFAGDGYLMLTAFNLINSNQADWTHNGGDSTGSLSQCHFSAQIFLFLPSSHRALCLQLWFATTLNLYQVIPLAVPKYLSPEAFDHAPKPLSEHGLFIFVSFLIALKIINGNYIFNQQSTLGNLTAGQVWLWNPYRGSR